MRSKLLDDFGGHKTFAVILQEGDEVAESLLAFATQHSIHGASITAIGGLSHATLGYFDFATKTYNPIPVDEQVELLSCLGDISVKDGAPVVHAHVVVGRSDGSTRGGHLLKGLVRPTFEAIVVESPSHLRRQFNPATGIPLIDPDL